MYGSWDMKCDGQIFLSFWSVFCPFTHLTTWKIKILRNCKKHLEISSFYNSVPKIMIICYTVPETWCVTDVIIFHFGPFFALYLPNSPKNQKFSKNEKEAWRYHHFTLVYQKPWSYAILFLKYGGWLDVIIFHSGLFFALSPP